MDTPVDKIEKIIFWQQTPNNAEPDCRVRYFYFRA
ncbi:hypothetical protein FH603_4376 [Spirosoma sp. LMG 31447]|uniref:Uncharacterized protein n=1 Tax=Spirosoma utsteinense TaxID=2585773 RepID=A0ABR6WBH7_9BACT|nr:hypothetical protein [Spirosoma utsteinense]